MVAELKAEWAVTAAAMRRMKKKMAEMEAKLNK